MSFRILGSIEKSLGLFFEHVDLILKDTDLVFQIRFVKLIDIDYVVVPVLTNGTSEADTTRTVFAETFYFVVRVIKTSEPVLRALDKGSMVGTSRRSAVYILLH